MPVVNCALTVASLAGMGGTRSVLLVVSVDVKVGPSPSIEDSFLDLKKFLLRFISLIIKVKDFGKTHSAYKACARSAATVTVTSPFHHLVLLA